MPTATSRRPASPPRRRRVLLAVAVAAMALLSAACEQMHPDNRAAGIPMATNGQLPLSYLASTTKGCVVYDEALASLNAMIAQAAKDGVTLRPSSCYRDYAGQVAAREDWCNRGACHMAAVPGTSNHGWGKAVDFADEKGTLDWDRPAYTWLKTWGWHFGWMHPTIMEPGGSVPEPWHFEWIGDGGKMFLGDYFGIGNGPLAVPRGQPIGTLDSVTPIDGAVEISGWAIDPDQVTPIPVHLYVDDAAMEVRANRSRPDVGAAFPLYAKYNHGFAATLGASPGRHKVCAYAINVSGTGFNALLGCKTVTVPTPEVSVPAASRAPAPAPTTTTSTTTPPTTSTSTSTTLAQGSPS
ncbi:MAG TPA: M15 family metallopeptidase [Acidimicrobiales bacterium]